MAEAARVVSWPPPAAPPDKIKFNLAVLQLYLRVHNDTYKTLSRNLKDLVKQKETYIRYLMTTLKGNMTLEEFYIAKTIENKL